MKITTAIFDLDGTLLNTLGDLCDSVTYAVEKHGFPPVSMEQTRIRIGNGKHLSGLLESIALEGVRVLNHVHIYARFPEGEYLVIKAA